ncbi:hypothetical protein OG927_05725 [Streptomyces clavifer]|uniref:hypothetical protein n=1 Tax=Streptomyces TaxID=1883 RepID=UPI000F555D87|nr:MULTISPECIES: hypothetical protein [Streptomyces]RPK73824.1 hypothetical protein EES45_28800 [Streptomyces sp. ADI97-07]WUC26888.1 hypothetical protein OG927_05725 [Streptomyces clavifer]
MSAQQAEPRLRPGCLTHGQAATTIRTRPTAGPGAFPEGTDRGRGAAPRPLVPRLIGEIAAALLREQAPPVATDPVTRSDPAAVPDHDTAILALEPVASDVAPALGRTPATEPEPSGE